MSRDTSSMANVLQGYINSEVRVDKMRQLNRIKLAKDEEQREEAMARAEIERRDYQKALAREQGIVQSLEARKMQAAREDKKIQLIRERAPEIRELEQKLQAAYTTKERGAQVAEAKYKELEAKKADMQQHNEMEALRQQAVDIQERQDAERKATLSKQKEVLEEQMRDREEAKLLAYKQFLEEKQIVDQVVAKIQAEDVAERKAKLEKQRMTQKYIEQYLEEREHFKQLEAKRRKDEDDKIVAFMKEQARRKEENVRLAKEKEAMQQKRLDEQSRAIAAERRRKEEMEELIADYHLELVEKKERERAREDMEAKIRARLVMIQANEYQKELKQIKREEEAEEELQFRQRMMEKFAEDDRIEQMKLADRNRKRAEHNREVQRLLEDRKAQRETERQHELELMRRADEKEDETRRVIQQERAKLLRAHAAKLKDYLPKGVFTEEDMRTLGISSLAELEGC